MGQLNFNNFEYTAVLMYTAEFFTIIKKARNAIHFKTRKLNTF